MVERYYPNKYKRWYYALMRKAKARVRPSSYSEKHHITPRALGGGNENDNIVRLTYREHFIAHWLLTKFTEGAARRKMLHAFTLLISASKNHQGKRTIASWQFEVARRAYVDSLIGRVVPVEIVEKVSVSLRKRYKNDPSLRKRLSKFALERWASAEGRAQLKQINSDPALLEVRRQNTTKRMATLEARRSLGEAVRLGSASKASKRRRSVSRKKMFARCPEARENQAQNCASQWQDPEIRRKRIEGIILAHARKRVEASILV